MTCETTRDAMEIIKHRFGIDPRTAPNVQAFADDFRIAQMIYDARQAAGYNAKRARRSNWRHGKRHLPNLRTRTTRGILCRCSAASPTPCT